LFHIFTKAGKRGYWVYFNKSKKKLLYLYGKKDYTYRNANIPKTGFKGVFFDKYTVDEKLYRARKKIALEDKEFGDDDEQKYYFQRNVLLKVLKDELHLSYDKISVLLAEYDLKLDKSSIFRAVKNNTKLKRGEDN